MDSHVQVPGGMGRYSPAYSPPRRGYGGRGRSPPPRRGYGGGRGDHGSVSLLVRNIPLRCRYANSDLGTLPHCFAVLAVKLLTFTTNFAGLRNSVSLLNGSALFGMFTCQETITLGKC